MMTTKEIVALTAVVAIVLTIIYIAWVYISTWYDIQKIEKQDVYICDIHGDILKQDMIFFLDQETCPRCFLEKWDNAGRM